MNDKVIRLQARMRHKNDTYTPPLKEGFLKMREPSKKEDTPKKIFLNIDGCCLINVDDISYVGIEKAAASGSGIMYTVKNPVFQWIHSLVFGCRRQSRDYASLLYDS